MPYRLFSQTNTIGSRQTAAKFSDSWNAPWLDAPSPKKASGDLMGRSLARPPPRSTVFPPPAMAFVASIPLSRSPRCIEPPLPRQKPVPARSSAIRRELPPLASVPVPPMRRADR